MLTIVRCTCCLQHYSEKKLLRYNEFSSALEVEDHAVILRVGIF